jgi:hypothetical protein
MSSSLAAFTFMSTSKGAPKHGGPTPSCASSVTSSTDAALPDKQQQQQQQDDSEQSELIHIQTYYLCTNDSFLNFVDFNYYFVIK